MSSLASGNWQSGIKNLSEGIRYIYQKEESTDCEFHVGQQKFKAHTLVLAARSKKFAELLMEPDAAYENVVDADSVTGIGFRILLDFIYTDDIGVEDKRSIVEAFSAAVYYQQPKLKEKCEEMINSWDICEDEVCNLFNVSRTVPVLKERCLRYIQNNAVRVILSTGFLDLTMDSLRTLLDENILEDVDLMMRIERIMQWGERRQTNPVNYAMVREDFLSCNPPLLKMMGLEQLDLQQFNGLFSARGRYPGMITDRERVNFMDYSADKKDRTLLPCWMN